MVTDKNIRDIILRQVQLLEEKSRMSCTPEGLAAMTHAIAELLTMLI